MLIIVNKIAVILTILFCVNIVIGFLVRPILSDLKHIKSLKSEISECEQIEESDTEVY